jgi:hypothetical protein
MMAADKIIFVERHHRRQKNIHGRERTHAEKISHAPTRPTHTKNIFNTTPFSQKNNQQLSQN